MVKATFLKAKYLIGVASAFFSTKKITQRLVNSVFVFIFADVNENAEK